MTATDMTPEALAQIRERVMQFKTMSLPGQPMAMHMGTSYLVGDLDRAIDALAAERDALRTALNGLADDLLAIQEGDLSISDALDKVHVALTPRQEGDT